MNDRLKDIHDAARIGRNPVVDADDAAVLYDAMVARDDYEALGDILDDIIEQSGITATESYATDIRELSLRFLAVRNAVAKLEPGFDLATVDDYRDKFDHFVKRVTALEAADANLAYIRDALVDFGAITVDDTTTDLAQMIAILLPPS